MLISPAPTLANIQVEKLAAYCAWIYVIMLFIGWWLIPQWMPPLSPTASTEEIVQIYQQDYQLIRVGMLFILFGAMFTLPYGAGLAVQLARTEGGVGVLTMTMIMGTFGNFMITFNSPMWWLTAAYRPDRDPQLMHLMSDIGWIWWLGSLTPFFPMLLVLVYACLFYNGSKEVFPRWYGYFSGWVFLLMLPDQILFFFKDGPFAWDGLLAFYVPVIAFLIWMLVTPILMIRIANDYANTSIAQE